MLSWFHALMPKEGRFFDLFEAHARTICAGARALRDMLDGGEAVPAHCRAIAAHEHEADEITHEVMLAVRRTFITPFDRSDIRNLVASMDDAVDQMHKTAKSVTLYELRAFEPDMVRLGDIIVKAADLTAESAPLLRSLKTNARRLNELNEQITRLEEESDGLYDAGMHALYKGPARTDPMAFIVGGEVYDHLEKVVDRLEDVSNRISGVLIEHL
jgi:predicted phosphate transport protein (TIGR00153 family)